MNFTEEDLLHIKTHRDFNSFYIQELEAWVKSMYLLPEEFEFQKKRILSAVKEKILQETGW